MDSTSSSNQKLEEIVRGQHAWNKAGGEIQGEILNPDDVSKEYDKLAFTTLRKPRRKLWKYILGGIGALVSLSAVLYGVATYLSLKSYDLSNGLWYDYHGRVQNMPKEDILKKFDEKGGRYQFHEGKITECSKDCVCVGRDSSGECYSGVINLNVPLESISDIYTVIPVFPFSIFKQPKTTIIHSQLPEEVFCDENTVHNTIWEFRDECTVEFFRDEYAKEVSDLIVTYLQVSESSTIIKKGVDETAEAKNEDQNHQTDEERRLRKLSELMCEKKANYNRGSRIIDDENIKVNLIKYVHNNTTHYKILCFTDCNAVSCKYEQSGMYTDAENLPLFYIDTKFIKRIITDNELEPEVRGQADWGEMIFLVEHYVPAGEQLTPEIILLKQYEKAQIFGMPSAEAKELVTLLRWISRDSPFQNPIWIK